MAASTHRTPSPTTPEEGFHLAGDDKRRYVSHMFDRLAERYDMTNLVISLGQTTLWRLAALRPLQFPPGTRVLDVGCGSGWTQRHLQKLHRGLELTALDVSHQMLQVAKRQDAASTYMLGDVTQLPYESESFDLALSFYTLRNFPDVKVAAQEMLRAVRPGGTLLLLDSFPVSKGAFGLLHHVWMRYVVPILIRPFTEVDAYRYLAESIEKTASADNIEALLRSFDGVEVERENYSLGSAVCFRVTKPKQA